MVATAAASAEASGLRRFGQSLTRRDWRSLGAMGAFIVALHVVGFGVLFGLVVPSHYQLGGDYPIFSVGVGILA
jgi:high-affinity nickel-transport protein